MWSWGVRRSDPYGVEALERLEMATPILTDPSEVLVEVHAASLNPIDVAVLGGYGGSVLAAMRAADSFVGGGCWKRSPSADQDDQRPLVVGRDFTGVVVSTGRGVRGLEAGQRVMGVVSPHKTGAHAQYVIAHQDNVVPAPSFLSSVESASVPYAALTAYSAAVVSGGAGNVRAMTGRRVLVAGASGGVGVMLVQMLRVWGAEVAGVCSSDSFDLLASLGVHELYDYTDKDAMEMISMEHSFDLVLDCSGGTSPRYLSALKAHTGASYVTLTSPLLRNTDAHGLLPGVIKSAFDLVSQNATSLSQERLVKWGYYMPSSTGLTAIRDMMRQKQLVPVIDKVFSQRDVKEAYKHMDEGRHRGKTVLDMTV